MGRRLMTGVVALAMVLWSLPLASTPAAAVSPDIVISQIYGGGGNVGATLKNDFIELYNRGASAVNVSGWSVQYASSTGTTWFKTDLSGWIRPGRYYLIQEAAGTGGTPAAVAPHVSGTIAMSATAGKVALLNIATLTTAGTACPSPTAVIDIVGYGTGTTCAEGGAPAATLSNTTAAVRKLGGAQDTDNNAADFTVAAPNPRATADYAITVTTTTPAGANVPLNTNISVTFTENAVVTGTWFTIVCASSGTHTATSSGGPLTFTLDPNSDFVPAETCTVTVLAAQVADQDTDDPPDQMSSNFVFTFTTLTPPALIREIQGAAHISPKNGQAVAGVPGIVTVKSSTGFWMQDPSPDADDATSEGIFVLTGAAPTVALGDAVTVSGRVTEFRPGSSGLSITELTGPIISVTSTGNALPPAVAIGAAGRTPPTSVIEDDATGNVETSGVFDPANDGIDFWESLEGMRVDLGFVVVTGPSAFDELGVLANNGAGATSRSARGGMLITASDKNPEKILMRGIGFNMPDSNTGDHFTTPIVGVVGYDFNNFMLEVPAMPTRVADGVTRETATAPGPLELTVATFNVENLDPGDPTFATLADLVVNRLLSPDVISLEEIQDNNGAINDGTVDASLTLTKLRDAIVAAGGPTYQWRSIDPVNLQDGGEPGGNIRQVFFFRTDRGVAFVDRPGAGSTTANSVISGGSGPALLYSPGRIQPTNSAFNSSRKPLAAEFTYNGYRLFMVANHWNSKGGDTPLWGHEQPPVLSSEVQRVQQATIVRNFVRDILALDANAKVVVLGDLNDFEFSNPLMILKSAPMNDLIETLPAGERYTYVFEGNSQALDHILVSNNLLSLHARTDIVHVNSEFWDQASDHDPQVATLPLADLTAPKITAPAGVSRSTGAGATSCTVLVSEADLGTATATDDVGVPTITRSAVPAGNLFPVGSTTITYTATDGSGNTATATQTVTVIDNTPPTISAPVDASYQLASLAPAADPAQATAADNCGAVSVTVADASNGGAGSPASPLVVTRTFTATDAAGNTAHATQTITVVDDTKPTIQAPSAVTRGTGAGAVSCTALLSDAALGTATSSDNSGTATITRTGVPSGNTFPLGATTITYTATDPSGNTATATQTVTVVDDTPPAITAPANAAYQLVSQVPAANIADATASDNCGAVTITFTAANNGGSGSPASPLVITRVYTATDVAGNHASATQTITVIDNTAPTISGAPTTSPNGNQWWNTAVTIHFTCADNSGVVTCPPDVTLTGDGADQSVTRTATDAAGNTATATFSNIDIDRTAPTITFSGATAYTPDQTVAITCVASDALSGIDPAKLNLCQSASGPAYLFLGTNTLNASVWDRAGNNATATTTFTVGVTSDSICTLIQRYVSKDGVAKSLCAKIAKAAERLAEGRDKNFENELKAFTNEVDAQRGKSITDANATLLITLAGML